MQKLVTKITCATRHTRRRCNRHILPLPPPQCFENFWSIMRMSLSGVL